MASDKVSLAIINVTCADGSATASSLFPVRIPGKWGQPYRLAWFRGQKHRGSPKRLENTGTRHESGDQDDR